VEAAGFAHQLGREGGTRDDGRFFHDHWNEYIATIDPEVCGDAEWELKRSDDVLNHLIGALDRKDALATPQGVELLLVETVEGADFLEPSCWVKLIETGNA
jgi:hypothetical protein